MAHQAEPFDSIDLEDLPPPVTHTRTSSISFVPLDASSSRRSTDESRLEGLPSMTAHPDSLERVLSASLHETHVKKLRKDYSNFKHRDSLTFFKMVVALSWFRPSAGRRSHSFSTNKDASGRTFSDCIEDLILNLQLDGNADCTRTCVVSMDSSALKLYGRRNLLTTKASRQRKQAAPIKAIAIVVGEEWDIAETVTSAWTNMVSERKDKPSLQLPSSPPRPFGLDHSVAIHRSLVWFTDVSKFTWGSRLLIYIFRPHTKPPRPRSAQIVIGSAKGLSREVLILLNFDGGLNAWSEVNKARKFNWEDEMERSDSTADIFRSICLLCLLAIEDTVSYVKDLENTLFDMVYAGREWPSRSRLQYLLCLEDQNLVALQGLDDLEMLIQDMASAARDKFSQLPASLVVWLEDSAKDTVYLQERLKIAEQRILDIRAMIKDQLELERENRTSLLTVLAAIYVPFSFVSSLFGMNLENPLWPSKIAAAGDLVLSNGSINSTVFHPNNESLLSDDTQAIIQAVNDSGPHLFTFKDYWIISGPVVIITTLFPILIGPVFRKIIRGLKDHTMLIVPFLMLLTIVASVATSVSENFTSFTVLTLLPFALAAVSLLVYSSVRGKDQLLWLGFAITYGCSLWIDTFISHFRIIGVPEGPWTVGLAPPLYILATHCGVHLPQKWKEAITAWSTKVSGEDGSANGEGLRLILAIIYYGAAIGWWYNKRDHGTFLAIPFALLAVNRIIYSLKFDGPYVFWIVFAIIWFISVMADNNFNYDSRASGAFITFLPMTTIFLRWSWRGRKLRVRESPQVSRWTTQTSESTRPGLERGFSSQQPLRRGSTISVAPASPPASARRRGVLTPLVHRPTE